MIDIHTHILPGVDDGAKTMDDSVQMIRQAMDAGVTAICATPHVLNQVTPDLGCRINRSFQLLRTKARENGLNVELMLGSEIYLRPDVISLRSHSFFSLNRTGRYVLIELPLGEIPVGTDRLVYDLRLEDITPVIAHPERSLTRKNQMQEIEGLVGQGALMQVNAGSLLDHFGRLCRKMTESLLDLGLVHVVASDAHDARSRSMFALSQAYRKIVRFLGENEGQRLFVHNPERILAGRSLSGMEGTDPKEEAVAERSDGPAYSHVDSQKLTTGGIG